MEAVNPSNIVKAFFDLLDETFNCTEESRSQFACRRIEFFAAAQNLHPNYLSNVIKQETGNTIGYWVNKRIISMDRSALSDDRLSIKEIAFRLKFSDPAHFNKYFKRHSGYSPLHYRRVL